MADYQNIRVETSDAGVVRLIIDRPKVLNAFDAPTIRELRMALDAVDDRARVVVVTGGGDKAFVAGADIAAMSAMSPLDARRFSREGHDMLRTLERLSVPTIAEVQGYALGGGLELMLACDFAIASERASFGLPEVTIGVLPGWGGTIRLGRRIGLAAAKQMMFTGARIKADEALRRGLVTEVVPVDELSARVEAVAAAIVQNAPVAVALAKQSANVGAETDIDSAVAYEQEVFGLAFSTPDQKEGMKAFLEKRKPTWQG